MRTFLVLFADIGVRGRDVPEPFVVHLCHVHLDSVTGHWRTLLVRMHWRLLRMRILDPWPPWDRLGESITVT